MSSTDLEIDASRLARLQRIFPGAVGQGWAHGLLHQTRGEVKRLERRGEVLALWRFERINRRAGLTRIPYVRLVTRAQVRRKFWVRASVLGASGGLLLAGVTAAAWRDRYALLAVLLLAGIGGTLVRFGGHWRRGCPGVHCSGCRG